MTTSYSQESSRDYDSNHYISNRDQQEINSGFITYRMAPNFRSTKIL